MNKELYEKISLMLTDPERQRDAVIIYLCEKLVELNTQLSEIRVVVNKKRLSDYKFD